MTEEMRPPFLRRKLGAKLRRMREYSGLTLDEAAPRLDKTKSALQRMETGETRADVHIARSMMDLYDCFDPDLLDEVREANKRPWFRAYGIKKMGYIDAETEAIRVDEFSGLLISGLLQTEAYMRELFRTRTDWTAAQADNDVAVRKIRQRRLISEERPLNLVAIIDEAALIREVGSWEIMRGQLRHLVEVAALPTVTLLILPLRGGLHHSMEGSFLMLTFPDPNDLELLYIEYPGGALHIEEEPKLREAKLRFGQLRSDALSPAESVALIEQLMVERYGS